MLHMCIVVAIFLLVITVKHKCHVVVFLLTILVETVLYVFEFDCGTL